MEEQEQRQLSPVEEMRLRVRKREQAVADFRGMREQRKAMEEAEADGPGFFAEAGKAVWGAGVDLVSEGVIMATELQRVVLPLDQMLAGAAYATQAEWGDKYDAFKTGMGESDASFEDSKEYLRYKADQIAPENETFAGNAARGILQFMVPYVGVAKAVGGINTFRGATAAGAAIDFSLFNPNDGNLSSLIKELTPETQSVVLDFLATDPDDDDALNRLRNALEGGVLGTALEGVFRMARFAISKKAVEDAVEEGATQGSKLDSIKAEVEEAKAKAEAEKVEVKDDIEIDESVPKADDAEVKAEGERQAAEAKPQSTEELVDTLRNTLKLDAGQRKALNKALLEGDDDAAIETLKDFNIDSMVDWSNVKDANGIKRIIETVSEVVADHIDDVKGGVQTHRQTARLANLVGVTGEQAHKLFKDVRGDKGIAARMLAAERTLLSSAKKLFELREIARAARGDLNAKANFMRHAELHAALQAEVKGAKTEIARALNGMKIIDDEVADGFREFDEMLRTFGGGSKRDPKDFEKFMDDLLDAEDLADLNAKVRMSTGQRVKNAFIEYVINAMLSSPKTHIINFTSNVLNTFLYTGDRYIGGLARRALGDKAALREANMDMVHKFKSLDEALRLAKQAWRDGAPVSDKRQRIEFQTRKAIAMDGDGAIARTVNLLGTIVRVPGRLLITGDEFFKAVNRNSEIAVLAYRQADEDAVANGLEYGTKAYDDAVQTRMADLMNPDNRTVKARDIRSQAIEKSRLVTFQESPRTGGGGAMERLINHNAFVKLLIAPFFRTPMNILRQGIVDRTPFGLVLRGTRDTLRNGGPREQAEVLARMTSGVAAMATIWPFIGADDESAFQIVGKVPYDSSLKAGGVLDYSIKLGDTWYQFNRLDPLGMWLGMMADAKMHTAAADDDEVPFAFMQGSLAGFMNNVTNKTWAKSVADLFDMVEGMRTNEPASVKRAWAQFSSGEVGKLIPQLTKSVGKFAFDGDERQAREAWTFFDGLNNQLPVLNAKVPPRHDYLGRPMTWSNGVGQILNPFAASEDPTALERELGRLDFTVRPMRRSLGSGLLDLTAEEYSKLTGLVGTITMSKHGNLEETLTAIVEGDEWETYTDARKVFVVKKYISAARTAAKLHFLKDDQVKKRFRDAKVEDFSSLLAE